MVKSRFTIQYPCYMGLRTKDDKVKRKSPPPFTEEHRRKLSQKAKGYVKSEQHRKNLSIALTGKKLSEETKQKIRLAHLGGKLSEEHRLKVIKTLRQDNFLGRHHTAESIEKMRNKLSGEKSYAWKGDDVGYGALHIWVSRQLGKPKYCSNCKKQDKTKRYHWANKSHKYKRDLQDWIRLCVPCHTNYDLGKIKI